MIENSEIRIVSCDCTDLSHAVQVTWFKDEPEDCYLYVTTILANRPWYKRIYYGLRYIFSGDVSRFGVSQEACLEESQVANLRDICDEFLRAKSVKTHS